MPTIEEIDAAYDAAVAYDVLVAKALKVDEVAQIAAAEERLRTFLIARWETLSKKAVAQSKKLTFDLKIAPVISESVDLIMSEWSLDVAPRFVTEIDRVYRLAREAGFKKAKGITTAPLTYDTPPVPEVTVKKTKVKKATDAEFNVVFDLIDEQAIEAMQEDNLFWIGEHYGKNVSVAVSETATETLLKQGASRIQAAEAMAEAMVTALSSLHVPGGYRGSARGYLEGLTANAMTTARVQGQIRSFENVGITTYEIVNPSDERTCPICSHMNGKVFTTTSATKQIELVQDTSSPGDVKNVHPWLSVKDLKAISPKAGAQGVADATNLTKAGFGLPPFHFRCRCTVDVSEASESFEALSGVA
jgi:SPP1 gp7 family putative phage head morphogenesis protein